MQATSIIFRSFITFRRIPSRIVLSTAAASLILSMGMYTLGQPLYMIALFALLPWMPVMLFESLWKVKHYSWIAIFAVVCVLQIGHVGEHIVQVGALSIANGTLACPPPVDNDLNAQRAVSAGLRPASSSSTGHSASFIVKSDPAGQALMDANGSPVTGPHACGVFGQLDLEIVHLVWEVAGWLLALLLLAQFPRNKWMWAAVVLASIHTVEHLFICYTFFFDPSFVYDGSRQVWGTLASGNIVTAFPLGKEPTILNFYDVAGRFGIAAKNGLIGALFPALNIYLPERPYLHFYYNTLVTAPMVVAFLLELRHSYNQYLAKAMPELGTETLVVATTRLQPRRFKPGETIIRQGERAEHFYIITQGEVTVYWRDARGQEYAVDTMHSGQFFGEIGLYTGEPRTATIRAAGPVEVMMLDCDTFMDLMRDSQGSRESMEQTIRDRLLMRLPARA